MRKNPITQLFGIKHPIVQAGMVWCSGWELAAAVSNAGSLGTIGSGSMRPHVLEDHIVKCQKATSAPFAVNVPLMYPDVERHMEIIAKHKVPVVFTSAGNPKTWTPYLKERGIKVAHVVSSARFALKAQAAGVDAVVAEGFEAGGHNGREETTTMCLVPLVRRAVNLPLLAAGGIASGGAMLAAMALGADGVQIGTRFVATDEASAHINFKERVVETGEGDTMLALKKLVAVRLIKNGFYVRIAQAEKNGADVEELARLLGRGRAKKGMFEGDMDEGELEIGQIAALVDEIRPAAEVVGELVAEFNAALEAMRSQPDLCD